MFENKKIFILGMARSGYEAAKILAKRNNEVVINDKNASQDDVHIKELENLGVKVILGDHPDDILDTSFDYIIKNPGVHFDHKYLLYAEKNHIKVINEIEMAYHLLPKDVKMIAITGTNGKTTTTSLTYEILKECFGKKVHLAGNIGFPLCSILNKVKEKDIIVMEIGVPQLHDMYDYRANIAVLTNIFEAHLDMFKTRKYYNQNKKRIFNNQTKEDIAIVNRANRDAYKLSKGIKATTKYFSSKKKIKGCYLKDNKIYYYDEFIIDTKDIKLQGVHNYENAMCAIMIAKELAIPNSIIASILKEFSGVEHRIEYVKTLDGVAFYNDSKATNIKATQIALSAFQKPTILLLGGQERTQSFYDLKDYLKYTKLVIAYGECKARIKKEIEDLGLKVILTDDLKEAVKIAKEVSEDGDIVLLSPASASWDQYDSFEIRGQEFKDIVSRL
ncbi:MAG TPA: UDP-N-acetylmuramoyl-L-alanine--D-glutamate ligase [Bacilli bacterium]|nr:UDP-N-acetylmuramoyl-L-alanine--D-glutamate ligase [Bacilli bacterium]